MPEQGLHGRLRRPKNTTQFAHALTPAVCALQTPLLGGWDAKFFNAWVDGHAADCAALGKPFVLEEFGKNVSVPVTPEGIAAVRDPVFATVYTKLLASLASGRTFQGAASAQVLM